MIDILSPIKHKAEPFADTHLPDAHQDSFSKTVLGFWFYLMSDCILFATFFTTYAVLKSATFGGPGPKDLFELPEAFAETMILLLSSLTSGISMLYAVKEKRNPSLFFLALTFVLGLSFIFFEFNEFSRLIADGNSFTASAFLSSFFSLVGTHGLHVSAGLIWLTIMFFQILNMGITATTFRRLVLFNMFWHFLDLIWIFIFTFVYLLGVL